MTDFFHGWCDPPEDETVKGHLVSVLTSNNDAGGIDAVVEILPDAYARRTNLERIAARYGKTGVAALLRDKVPTKKSSRSGDMGEILGTVYLREVVGYVVGPSRLIERDHQEWAMRGDDILGAKLDSDGELQVAKVEAKSRSRAGKPVIAEARAGLHRNDDLASPHSLVQFAERLIDDDPDLSDAINDVRRDKSLREDQMLHILFLFAGNHPAKPVRDDLTDYQGKVEQRSVTVQVTAHQDFIQTSYERAIADGH